MQDVQPPTSLTPGQPPSESSISSASLEAPKPTLKDELEKPRPAIQAKFKQFKVEEVGIPVNIGDKTRGYLFCITTITEAHRQIPIIVLIMDTGKITSFRAENTEIARNKALELCNGKRESINLPPTTSLGNMEKKFTASALEEGFGLNIVNSSEKGEMGLKGAISDYSYALKEELSRSGLRRTLENLNKSEEAFLQATDSILPPAAPASSPILPPSQPII